MTLDDPALHELAERLVGIGGDHTPESDVDLGLYYDGDLDVTALGALAREVAGPEAAVTRRGDWRPWSTGAPGCASAGDRWTGSSAT